MGLIANYQYINDANLNVLIYTLRISMMKKKFLKLLKI